MGANSKIEWTEHTFNPWMGCQKVSHGCDNCYAEAMMDHRYGRVTWGPHGERVRTSPSTWAQPRRWARQARDMKCRPRVFCASLADVFDNRAPESWRTDLWDLVAATPELDWLLLTKRPENIAARLPGGWDARDRWRHVWLGITAEDQERFDRRWPVLAGIEAEVRFVSYEPALGPLTVASPSRNVGPVPDWVICGGETGAGARAMDPAWARAVRDECAALGIAFFMKQMTDKAPIPADLRVRRLPLPASIEG